MDVRIVGAMIPIVSTIGVLTMIVFLRRYTNIERMAMIERGMNPKDFKKRRDPYRSLRFGFTAVGVGIGLFVGNLAFGSLDSEPLILGFTIMLGGVGLLLGYLTQFALQKQARQNKDEKDEPIDDEYL